MIIINKVGKGAMYVMGTMAASMISYYMGMPKNKRQDLKNKMSNMIMMKDSSSDNNM